MNKLLIRFSVILFWLALIFTILYWPKWEVMHFDPRSINVFAWGDILEPSIIADFERETGIKIHLNYYSSNEELLVKLKATKGEGYDLIVPSDYAVDLLIEEGLLKEIDHSKIFFYRDINPLLLGHDYDPDNRYSLPFEWEICGLGVDKSFFQNKPFDPSWRAIFDPSYVNYKITMLNDPVETILLGAFYLYGTVDELDPTQFQTLKNLLFTQKRWVEAYADFRGDYFLATRNCPVVVAFSSYIWRSMKKFDFIDFVVPKEGSFLSIENLSIPKASNKEELVYEFINYLFRMQSVEKHFYTYGFFPSVLHPTFMQGLDEKTRSLIESSLSAFRKYHFTKVLVPYHEIQNLWVELKTRSSD
ncbi:MAG: PotD/PotF family extracellular solute-binding protein [Chlamydiales bacterium]